jgi:hypothetical protein
MNVEACTCLPATTAMSRLDLRVAVIPARAAAAGGPPKARARRERNRARRR